MRRNLRQFVARAARNGSAASIVEIVVMAVLSLLVFRVIVGATSLAVFGIWTLTQSLTSLVRMADVGVSGSLAKYIGELDTRTGAKPIWTYVDSALLFNLLFFSVLSLAAYLPLALALGASLPSDQAALAVSVLPVTLVNLTLGSMSGVPATALIGLRRGTAKSALNISSSVVLLIASLLLVHRFGLLGLTLAQTAQGAFMAIAGWMWLTRVLHGPREFLRLPAGFDLAIVRSTIRLSVNMQLNTVISSLYEVVLKLALGAHGGASVIGLYELVNRFVRIARQVILMPALLSVPILARGFARGRLRALRRLYRRQMLLTIAAAILIFAGVLVVTPLASLFVLRHLDARFFQFFAVWWAVSIVNVLGIPAYMLGLGSGRLRGNFIGNMAGLVGTGVLANLLGYLFGALGALIGGSIALGLGGILTMWLNGRMFSVPIAPRPREVIALFRPGALRHLVAPLLA